MTSLRTALRDQRGSAMLAALALAVVMTIMGLALFDLGRIENALVLANKTDAQAFEIAQAGIERAMDRLLRTLVAEAALTTVAMPDGIPSWHDGHQSGGTTTDLCAGGCDLTTNSTLRAFRAVNSAYISNLAYNGGTYAIAFRLLTQGEARNSPFSQTCRIRDLGNPANDDEFCTDLILVRSMGTRAGIPPGYTGEKVLQALVKASSTAGIGGGITVGSQTRFVSGNVNIFGSIAVVDTPASATQAWEFRGGANQQNNWAGLPNAITDRLRPRQLVCPPGRSCPDDSNKVESLDATLAIRTPLDKRAVDINSGAAFAGTAADSAAYGSGTAFNPTRKGKGPLNGVFIADGCVMPCDQNGTYVVGDPASKGSFTGRVDQVHVDGDNVTNPYPVSGPTSLPQLTDQTTIAGVTYTHYACAQGSTCAGVTGGTQEFFVSNALNSTATITVSPSTAAFTINNVPFIDKVSGTRLTTGVICWKRPGATSNTLEFFTSGSGGTCASSGMGNYTSAQNPLMVYTTGSFSIGGDIQYSGGAIFLVAPVSSTGVSVQNNIVNACVTIGSDPCGRKFLTDPQSPTTTDMLSVLTTGAVGNGNIAFGGNNGDTLMGIFYAGVPTAFATGGEASFSHQITVVGAVSANNLTMTQVPNFYQVPGLIVPELLFGSARPWAVVVVGGFWRICAPGNPATTSVFPTTATGVCGYN
jgi:Tfp pilus assembly protein PilX